MPGDGEFGEECGSGKRCKTWRPQQSNKKKIKILIAEDMSYKSCLEVVLQGILFPDP
jgi:hypothetical protein